MLLAHNPARRVHESEYEGRVGKQGIGGPTDGVGAVTPDGGRLVTNRDGVPLSFNRAPADDVAPWLSRMVGAKIWAAPDARVECAMCNDTAYVRSVIGGNWTATTADGRGAYLDESLVFGPHSKAMPLTCTGPVYTAGFGLRPGALYQLWAIRAETLVDRIASSDIIGLKQEEFAGFFRAEDTPEHWLDLLEELMREQIRTVDPDPPDPVTTAFDHAAFEDPNLCIADFAEIHGVGIRQLERRIKRDFGHTPKQVLRRARALDFAAQLLNVADDAEEEEVLLRYSDQSHAIREFTTFFGITPHRFRSVPHPLMIVTLETRQARRMEELKRIEAGGKRPWLAEGI